jgi:hypothetical protein
LSHPIAPETRSALLSALRAAAGNVAAAARDMGISETTVKSRVKMLLRDGDLTEDDLRSWRRPSPASTVVDKIPPTSDECWQQLDAAIGRRRGKPEPPAKRAKFSDKRVVIAGDFHAPFHAVEAVGAMLAQTDGFDQLIVNGDLQDFYAISRFTKHESVPMEREFAAVDGLLEAFSRTYPDVLVVDGNHDRPRFEKQLRTMLSLDMIQVLELLTDRNFSAIAVLAKRYPNIRFAPVQVGRHKLSWCAQEGDLIVAHAEKYSRVPGAALRGIEEWFSDQHEALGLQPWRVLIQAHTHQLGWFPWRSDRLLVEGGAMCGLHGYQLDARIAGRPQRLGYVTLTQRDGVTDIGSVRCHWLDPQLRAA